MTKKYFELIAAAFNDAHDDHQRAGRYGHAEGVLDAASVLSRRLAGENPCFDRKRFLIACGFNANSRAVREA